MARLNAATAAQRAKERVTGKPEGVPAAFFVAINTNAGGSVGTLLMQDIATMFGAPIYTNLEDVLNSHGAPIVQSTLTVNGTRSILSNIPDETRALLNARADAVAQELSSYEMGDRFSVRAKFNETRIRNLRGELITIFVGGETYSDVKERIDRFEDVVKAVKSALVNGVLPGVGSSLVTAGKRVLTRLYRELPDPFKDGTDTPHEREIAIKVMIISALAEVCYASHNHLMRQTSDEVSPFKELRWNSIEGDVVPPCTNLATGETGTSEELGVYDTAYATITALKGGLQTAKILANASSILLGDKLSAVPMKR
jgi:chaperonin GroEL (HSP60 family)